MTEQRTISLETLCARVDPEFNKDRHKRVIYEFPGTDKNGEPRRFYQTTIPGQPYPWVD